MKPWKAVDIDEFGDGTVTVTDRRTFRDIREVARSSGMVVTGQFAGKPVSTNFAELFGLVLGASVEERSLHEAELRKEMAVWEFRIDSILEGNVDQDPAVLVMVELGETDVPDVAVDPGRVLGKRVVLLLEAEPRGTTLGDAYYLTDNYHLGSSFAVVDQDGILEVDPLAAIPLDADARESRTSVGGSLERQLGLD